jgi:hypothetical protein
MVDGLDEFWKSFGDSSAFVEVECGTEGSLAAAVLSAYGIPCNSQVGGSLPNIDIKRMDAIQTIKLSLLEASSNDNQIYEPIMNAEGIVEFVAIGAGPGLSGGDIYYEIQSGTYKETCGGVMVIGALPLSYRRDIEWSPIWEGGAKMVYDTSLIVNEHCLAGDFSQQATIVFNDPHLDSTYKDGIDNLYEITEENAYDTILGYARFVEWPGYKNDKDAVVRKEDTAKILLPLPLEFGTFAKRPKLRDSQLQNPGCWDEATYEVDDVTTGVKLEIPGEFRYENIRGTQVDKFQGILDVYVIGLELTNMRQRPPSDSEAVNKEPEYGSAVCEVTINKAFKECTRLSRGTHYVIGYEEMDSGDKTPYVIFANNSRLDLIDFSGSDAITFKIDPRCAWANENKGITEQTGMVLPIDSTRGILVYSMFVSVILNTPSIVVQHPDGWGKKAFNIADSLTYWVAPIVSVEPARPVAFNGTIIDMTQGIQDHDPTTTQSFEDTDYEKAMDEINGNGMTLNLSFLNEEQCAKLSGALYDYLNSGDGTESTYICGPDAEPSLGGTAPNGGIVNSIVYSYQDSNSYTISVNAGPTILGDMAQVEGGLSPMRSDDVSAVGTVIQDTGSNIYFKVRIDAYGERLAINLSPNVIRVGDKVSCVIHNNPVES